MARPSASTHGTVRHELLPMKARGQRPGIDRVPRVEAAVRCRAAQDLHEGDPVAPSQRRVSAEVRVEDRHPGSAKRAGSGRLCLPTAGEGGVVDTDAGTTGGVGTGLRAIAVV